MSKYSIAPHESAARSILVGVIVELRGPTQRLSAILCVCHVRAPRWALRDTQTMRHRSDLVLVAGEQLSVSGEHADTVFGWFRGFPLAASAIGDAGEFG